MIFVGRRLEAAPPAGLAVEELLHEDHEQRLDLDKAWHGIHFLLTGSPWETTPGAGESVLGGEPVGPGLGYGPARLLDPDRVRAVAAGLRAVTAEDLRARYEPGALTEAAIYPQVWDAEDFDAYLLPHFTGLREFYVAAAGQGQSVLLAIT